MVATKQYTFEDLLTITEEQIYDIWGGQLVVYSSPADPHQAVVGELLDMLIDAQRAGYGWVRTSPRAVAFDFKERGLRAQDVTHPDIHFVRRERREIIGHRCVEAAPDLVIEVLSPSTRQDDLPGGGRWSIYERYGVPHYWIVDTDERSIAEYEWHDGRYGAPTVLRGEDLLGSPLFPSVTRPVREIFDAIL